MSRFANLKSVKKHKFVNIDIDINKLSVAAMLAIQAEAKEVEAKADDMANVTLMLNVIRAGVAEMRDMTDQELLDLPMDELSKLSAEIMEFSGLGKAK